MNPNIESALNLDLANCVFLGVEAVQEQLIVGHFFRVLKDVGLADMLMKLKKPKESQIETTCICGE
jgi:hypothetical protein